MISRNKLVAAVEMGSSKVSVLIIERGGDGGLYIVGFGECRSQGIKKGMIVDAKKASMAVHTALEEAMKEVKNVRPEDVILAQTGAHLDGFYHEAKLRVSANDNRVSAEDVRRICTLAQSKELPEGRSMVQRLRRPFRLDGQIVGNPEGIVGRELEVGYWMVHGDVSRLSDELNLIRDYRMEVQGITLSSLASGRAVSTALERQKGVLVLDIGAGTTDYVLYANGAPYVTGVLAVGGGHLTNDLSLGLRINEGEAETLKLRHGRVAWQVKERKDPVWLRGDMGLGDKAMSRTAIEQILSARVQEIFSVVKKKLGTMYSPEWVSSGVVLTGGTSKLSGIDEVASRVFEVPARLGEAPAWVEKDQLKGPGYSTLLGLLHYAIQPDEGQSERRGGGGGLGGWLNGIFGGKR